MRARARRAPAALASAGLLPRHIVLPRSQFHNAVSFSTMSNSNTTAVPGKLATMTSSDDDIDWRQKSIQEFKLLPIPHEWTVNERVSTASNHEWRAYYSHRKICKKHERTVYKGTDNVGYDYGYERSLRRRWKEKLKEVEQEISGCKGWSENVYLEVTDLYGYTGDTFRVEYKALVWSIYAIPHAIQLEHWYYENRTRSWSIEFDTKWSHSLKTYREVFSSYEKGYICSNECKAGRICFETIDTTNLHAGTVGHMQRHLFGSELSSKVLNKFDFMKLIFASMATPYFQTLKKGDIGYVWRPDYGSKLEKKILGKQLVESLEDMAIRWLEYEVRRASDALRPIDKYYQPPNHEKYPAYDEYRL